MCYLASSRALPGLQAPLLRNLPGGVRCRSPLPSTCWRGSMVAKVLLILPHLPPGDRAGVLRAPEYTHSNQIHKIDSEKKSYYHSTFKRRLRLFITFLR